MPAVDSDDGEAGRGESVRDECTGNAGAYNRYVATTVARQWWRHFSQAISEQPESLRRGQLQVARRFMSAVSRTCVEYPLRATAIIARPSCSVVVMIPGAMRLSMG